MRFRALHFLWVLVLGLVFMSFGTEQASADAGMASWYGPGFAGEATASGEIYNPDTFTAAHKTLPLGTKLNVSYGGRSVQVRVNDRGPYVGARELDLSRAAAETLGLKQSGVGYVTYTYAGGVDNANASEYHVSGTKDPLTSTSTTNYSGSQAQQQGGEYTVQTGDTLWEISNELGTSVEYLASTNGIENPNLIYSGTVLQY
jgi:rare lipoprotein A